MIDPTLEILALLALAAFLAGFIDSIAGGGGLVTVPALLLAGFAPVEALGTNKLQGLFGAASATIAYAGKGHVDLKRQLPSAVLAGIGGVAGALLATVLPGDVLRILMPFLLVAIAHAVCAGGQFSLANNGDVMPMSPSSAPCTCWRSDGWFAFQPKRPSCSVALATS